MVVVGGGGGGNAAEGNSGFTGAAVGASLGLLALIGVGLVFLLFLKRRKPAPPGEAEGTELQDDGGDFDSTVDGSDGLFVSEYGFSDKHASSGANGLDEDSVEDFQGEGEFDEDGEAEPEGEAADGVDEGAEEPSGE